MNITTAGIDLAKSVSQIHGVDLSGRSILRKKIGRKQIREFFAQLPLYLVGMEA